MSKQRSRKAVAKNPKKQMQKQQPPAKAPSASKKLLRDEALESRILVYLETQEKPRTPEQVAASLQLSVTVVEKLLKSMYTIGSVGRTRKHAYALPEKLGILSGTIQGSADGNGSLILEDGRRYFVPRSRLLGAMHDDRVQAREERDIARVERILQRANQTIVGTLRIRGRKALLMPENRRLPSPIPLATGNMMDAGDGDLVVARVLTFADEGTLRACVQQRLGEADQVRAALAGIVYQYGFSTSFDPDVGKQAEKVAAESLSTVLQGREDFRNLVTFTIDGADAQDFDDAVSIETLDNGLTRLGVHIADVSHYVQPGTLLDAEALHRGTSVYLPGLVLPMLPEALSNGSCSLRPDEDRLTLSVLMDLDQNAHVQGYRIAKSVIHSHARLVYEEVNALLAGDEVQDPKYAGLLPQLSAMAKVAAKIRTARYARGSLDFDMEEALIIVDAQGEPVEITQRARGISNRMIEDFMLLANETVARHAKSKNLPFLYRVHEQPDSDRLTDFQTFLAGIGLQLRVETDHVTPKALQQLLEEAEGRPDYPVISQLMIRSMAKARYAAQPLGHFGLAAGDYCHFTSPIRRYPDLWIHRVLTAEIEGKLAQQQDRAQANAPSVAAQSSAQERKAMEAERAADKLMMARYMLRHVGESYDAVVTGVVEWGLYVSLPNTIEGLVHVRTLDDDFHPDAQRTALIGTHSGVTYRLGQSVRVIVRHVDVAARQIDFELDEHK